MSTSWGSADAKCPFYLNDRTQNILCEGAHDGAILNSAFKRGEDKDQIKRRYCDKNYHQCRIYKMLMTKYEEMNDDDNN